MDQNTQHADTFSQCNLSSSASLDVVMQVHATHFSAPLVHNASAALIECFYTAGCNEGMTIEQTRRENLLLLIKEAGGISKLADLLEHNNPTQVSQWKNATIDHNTGKPRNISSASARRLEEVCGKPKGWMDVSAIEESSDAEWGRVVWLWNHRDAEIKTMFGLLVGMMYEKKIKEQQQATKGAPANASSERTLTSSEGDDHIA